MLHAWTATADRSDFATTFRSSTTWESLPNDLCRRSLQAGFFPEKKSQAVGGKRNEILGTVDPHGLRRARIWAAEDQEESYPPGTRLRSDVIPFAE
jgi:hypothetical protein